MRFFVVRLRGNFGRCFPTIGGMRPDVIAVSATGGHNFACMMQLREQRFIQTFIAQASIEAFNEGVLRWLAWRGVMPICLVTLLPFEHGDGTITTVTLPFGRD
jgi:hypothetical protein